MENKSYTIYLIPVILIFLVILFAIIYFSQKNEKQDLDSQTVESSTEPISENVLGTSTNYEINDGTAYKEKITTIRQPINDVFTELSEKIKYPDLYTNQDILKIVVDGRSKILIATNQLGNLSTAPKFDELNQIHKQSLTLLKEALDNMENGLKNKDEELIKAYNTKIQESNKLFENVGIPQ